MAEQQRMESSSLQAGRRSWSESIAACFQGRVLSMLFLGFSAGLPLLLIFSSLSLWLREAGVARSTVTYFSWASLFYSFKFVWAPLIDRLPLPYLKGKLGQRRSWLLLAQMGIIFSLLFMSAQDPQSSLQLIAVGTVMLGFTSATQDIVIDAYRIERGDSDIQAMMSSAYIAGYRVGMIASGAGALVLAGWFGSGDGQGYNYSAWSLSYICMAGAMLVGVVTTLFVSEPKRNPSDTEMLNSTEEYLRFLGVFIVATTMFIATFVVMNTYASLGETLLIDIGVNHNLAAFVAQAFRLISSVVAAFGAAWLMIKLRAAPVEMVDRTYLAPFRDFFSRYGKAALFILLLVGTYRISDIVMGTVANVFYDDMGYSKDQIAGITKTFGLIMTIVGGFIGGLLAMRYGVIKSLWLGAFLAAGSNALFALLAVTEPEVWMLAGVIAADNMSGGLASAAFVAYLSGLTNRSFTAMQYAVFSSLMTLFPHLLGGYSGSMVDTVGYPMFFIGSALIGIPVLFLVTYVDRRMPPPVIKG